jgi:hypothetical protein
VATVQVAIVNRALRLLEQIPSGGSPSSSESDDALVALNSLIDSWKLDKSLAYAMREETLPLVASTPSYTIGASGVLVTTRPVAIEDAWIVVNNVTYSTVPMTEDEYAMLLEKGMTSDWPDRYLYRASYPNGTLIVYPVPNAARTMKLLTRTPLTALALSDTLAAPPGWERGMAYNLAVEIASEYEMEAPPTVQRIATATLRKIKRQNTPPVRSVTEIPLLVSPPHGRIITG